MIRPSARDLTDRYGMTAAGRRLARQEMVRIMVEAARSEAAHAGRSLRCIAGHHRGACSAIEGCRNAGEGCLCECHDPPG